ncbi:MAG TPA: type II and III secretion system protein family protein [Sphingorhabdus lacus]|jgi:pilus assembly protein CpaC|uniref:type II and III secretion system protein family protein n=1 Tax=Sphingorhabdus lacus TaxID=392610 RepID=UPI002BE0591E|nr:type II and III secretion system protein family protein [Sphingorhabdus lacus]HPV67001.1 type II and III secretion system protein family protein [Sphingorhabdus lacus]
MNKISKLKSGFAAAALTAALGTTALVALPTVAHAQSAKDAKLVTLSIGRGQQINLGSTITDVVVANPQVADVEVKSGRQIYILAKNPGETSIVATDAAGRTVYSATVRVGMNLDSIDQMLAVAMPDADIKVTTMNGIIMLTGTVKQPEEASDAADLVTAFSGGQSKVVNRIKTATPLQINLQVRVAEVSRSLSKEISGNIQGGKPGTNSSGDPYFFGLGRGRDFTTGTTVTFPESTTTVAGIGKLFGIDVEAAFDLSERAGLVSTLANPNLTTVSGETAEFLAGGTFPVVTSSDNGVSVQYQSYGVSLTYTPVVLADGRISLRVRSEVSDISSQGAVRVGGLEVPATTTRMAETTVELGSGQSMMIAGLLSNQLNSSVDKTPGVGDIPVLGALFKSNGWRRNETELMIVITPYLVKPVSDSEIKLPTDGIHSANDAERVLLGKVLDKNGDKNRPMPTIAPAPSGGPEMGSISEAAPALPQKGDKAKAQAAASGPGFSFDQ